MQHLIEQLRLEHGGVLHLRGVFACGWSFHDAQLCRVFFFARRSHVDSVFNVLPALVQLGLKLLGLLLRRLGACYLSLLLNFSLFLSDLLLERVDLCLESVAPLLLSDHRLVLLLTWCRCALSLKLKTRGHLVHLRIAAADDLLRRGRCPHLLLLFQKFESGQTLVQLAKSLVLLCLFGDALLVPALDHAVLGVLVVHEGEADLGLLCFGGFFEGLHCVVDLSSRILGEEQDLVGALNEDLLPRPVSRYASYLLQHFLVLQAQHDHFVLQNRELQDAVEPG